MKLCAWNVISQNPVFVDTIAHVRNRRKENSSGIHAHGIYLRNEFHFSEVYRSVNYNGSRAK